MRKKKSKEKPLEKKYDARGGSFLKDSFYLYLLFFLTFNQKCLKSV